MNRSRTHSLVTRALLVVLAAQLLSAVFLCGAALLHERHTRLRALETRMEGRSDSLLGAIQDAEDPDDNVTIDPAELKLPGNDVYAVYNRGSRLLGASLNAPSELIQRNGDGFRTETSAHTRYRVYEREAMRIIDRPENGGIGLRRPVTIVYATPEGHLWHEIFEAARFYLLATIVAATCTTLLVAFLLRRSLSPLNTLADATARLKPPTFVFSPPEAAMRVRELRPLAEVLSASALRVRQAFQQEQRFLSDAAHELKTAIAVVRSSVQLLMLKRRSAEEYGSGLERILEDNSRVEALVAQMLQLSRIDGFVPDSSQSDLGAVASAVLHQLRTLVEMRGVAVELTGPHQPAIVRLPFERASVLISNLVLNAVQHTSPGEPVRVIIGRPSAADVVLEVLDRGDGISPEALPHVFDRFYRVDRSRSRETGGTGLGLSICKSIVESAQGSITIDSVPGHGTRVVVTFSIS